MPGQPTDFSHLTLRIQHLLDAELLLETEADGLLAAAQAARQAREQGEDEAGRQHVEAVVDLTKALIRSEALAPADAHALLAVANGLLRQDASQDA